MLNKLKLFAPWLSWTANSVFPRRKWNYAVVIKGCERPCIPWASARGNTSSPCFFSSVNCDLDKTLTSCFLWLVHNAFSLHWEWCTNYILIQQNYLDCSIIINYIRDTAEVHSETTYRSFTYSTIGVNVIDYIQMDKKTMKPLLGIQWSLVLS